MKEDAHKANDDISEEILIDQTIKPINDNPLKQSNSDCTNPPEKTDLMDQTTNPCGNQATLQNEQVHS